MPKRKRDASALDKPLSGSGRGNARGGAGRGQGRKAAPRPFAEAAAAAAQKAATPEQKSISEMLGMRKKEAQPTRDVISWFVELPDANVEGPVRACNVARSGARGAEREGGAQGAAGCSGCWWVR